MGGEQGLVLLAQLFLGHAELLDGGEQLRERLVGALGTLPDAFYVPAHLFEAPAELY